MDSAELVDTYLRALETGDVGLAVGLFAPDNVVQSPLYGPLPAELFYPRLFADTGSAVLTLRSVMRGADRNGAAVVSFWFHFDWRLPDGTPAPFEVVDVAELDEDGRIVRLSLIYDTVDVRPAFEKATGRRSWRAHD
ncbi:nuclear transport factor 2 family protein [Actinoplanes sp. M2I2]|uniref:nuclear transport factor 2 family protein n=1 Tax=Actinoplanes sp. M2I2 TaxID=1734444 RepID=UPI00202023CA|nr:nuclear transport factor 2 family protein [Actinoplanes sp. M2I2]